MKNIVYIYLLFTSFCFGQHKLFNEINISLNQKAVIFNESQTGFGFGLRKLNANNTHFNMFYGLEYNFTQQHRNLLLNYSSPSGFASSFKNVNIDFHNLTLPIGYNYQVFKQKKYLAFELGVYGEFLVYSSLNATQQDQRYEINSSGIWEFVEFNTDVKLKNQFKRINGGLLFSIKTSINTDKFEYMLKPEFRFSPFNLYKQNDYLENSILRLSFGVLIN